MKGAVAISSGVGLVLLMVLAAAPAWSAALDYEGTLTLSLRLGSDFSTVPQGPAIVSFPMTGTGVAAVNGSGGLGHLTHLSFAGSNLSTAGAVASLTTGPPISGAQLTIVNGAAGFSGTGGSGFGGVMPLSGAAQICLFGPCTGVPVLNVSVPLSVVGLGGTSNVSFSVQVTVQGAPWTTGIVPFGTTSASGFVHGPASGTSSTAAVGGAVRLVTPILISTNIPALATIPAVGILDLRFVPEPATLLLFGSGVAVLVGMGRRRIGPR